MLCVLDKSLHRACVCPSLAHIVGKGEVIVVCVERGVTILIVLSAHECVSGGALK